MFMTSFHSSFSTLFSTVFSQILAKSDRLEHRNAIFHPFRVWAQSHGNHKLKRQTQNFSSLMNKNTFIYDCDVIYSS